MKNILDLLQTLDKLLDYSNRIGIEFNKEGYPIFKKEMFLKEEPDIIIPFSHRNDKRIIDKKKTLICTFAPDREIYPRITKLLKEINEYKDYIGVASLDLTVTDDMDIEWQRLILFINQLYAAILAGNGIKIVFNTRIGSIDNINILDNIPKDVMCISGFLGCRNNSIYDYSYIQKIIKIRPGLILIYGKQDKNINSMMNQIGINYKYYDDYHRICRKEYTPNGR